MAEPGDAHVGAGAVRNDWDPHPIDMALGCLILVALATACVVFFGLPAYGQQYQGPTIRDKVHVLGQMDLPVEPPTFGGTPFQAPAQPEPEPDPDDDDPRDTPPPVFYGEEIDTESDSLIYVLDRSGSMGGHDKWERARDETLRSVQALSDNFRFNVIVYSSTVSRIWSETQDATQPNKTAATIWLEAWWPGGGTYTDAALAVALSDKENRTILLLSDGAPTGGPRPALRVEEQQNTQGATIHCFGVDAWGELRSFLQHLASVTGGRYVDVP